VADPNERNSIVLQSIRDRAQGWFATVVFGILIIPFTLWGINWYVTHRNDVVVAKVNGAKISLGDYEAAMKEQRRYLQSLGASTRDIDQGLLRQQTIDKLVNDELLKEARDDRKLRIGNQDLAAAIQTFPAFQKAGKFDLNLYDARLRELGLSPAGFEERMRGDLAIEQLRQGISDTNFVTQAAVDGVQKLRGQKRDVSYATIAVEPLKAGITPTDADIEAYYKANEKRFMSPEQVKIAYLELSADMLAKSLTVDEQALQDYYETHKATTYTTPEERSANHILVHVPKDAKPEEAEKARKTAEEYYNEAKGGKDFEKIAMEKSDDVGSKAEGGKTGFFRRGVMAKEFDEAVFSMQPGELRGPIRTEFGWHVIRLNEIKKEAVKSFSEARADVEAAVRKEQAEKLYFEKADQLSTLTYENSDSLEPAAKALGLTITESDFFPRSGGKELLANANVIDMAFSSEVLNERLNSQPVEIGPTHTLVLRMVEHKPEALRPLAEVRDEVVKLTIDQLARGKAEELGKQYLERLQKGEPRDAIAQAGSFSWTDVKGATRDDDTKLSRAVARLAFRTTPSKDGETAYNGLSVGAGDYVLVAVTGLSDGDAGKADDPARKTVSDQMFASYANNDWRDFLADLKSKAKVTTFTDRL
jgi:peptidyl-prolyl cis-trans isomerase D